MKRRYIFGVLVASLAPAPARATYSIAAADAARGQIGGAGASCVGSLDVSVIYGGAPGVGVVHAQARLHLAGRERAVRRLTEGRTPAEILEEIASAEFDRSFEQRQYGVVTLDGAAEAFTGRDNGRWAGHQTGAIDDVAFSAQGNLLTGPPVVSRVAAAFTAGGCDLAARLMQALEAGGAPSEGDARCTGRGVPADSAFLRVQGPDGSDVVRLSVADTGRRDPVAEIRAAYDAWRAEHPCAAPDAGVADLGGADAAPADAGSPDARPRDGGAGPDARDTTSGGCRATEPGAPLVVVALLLAARRRQSRGRYQRR